MNEEQFYKDGISKMISSIHNVEWLRKIYSFSKVFFDDVEDRKNGERKAERNGEAA